MFAIAAVATVGEAPWTKALVEEEFLAARVGSLPTSDPVLSNVFAPR
jgi:hypothetical protein